MGLRFHRSIKLLPGLRIHLSKTGVSASVGTEGASVNIGQRGVRGTVGLPGSGVSYSERLDKPGPNGARFSTGAKLVLLGLALTAAYGLGAWLSK